MIIISIIIIIRVTVLITTYAHNYGTYNHTYYMP